MENTMMKDNRWPQSALVLLDPEALLDAIERLEAAIHEFRRACATEDKRDEEGSGED